MRVSRASLAIFCLLLVGPLCAQTNEQQQTIVEGKLLRVAGIGGESTGWGIRLDQAIKIQGNLLNTIEVAGQTKELEALENKHVEATGRISTRRGVERGEWPVLEIGSVRETKTK